MAEKSATPSKKEGDEGFVFFIYATIGVLALCMLIPFVLATAAFVLLRRHLGKREAAMLAVTGLIALLLDLSGSLHSYFTWLGALVTGHGSRLGIPLLPLGAMVMLLAGTALSLQDTRIASAGLARIGRKNAFTDTESIVPTQREKQRAQVVAPPGGQLTIHADNHSITAQTPFGKRTFPVGIDKKGRPVVISEDEIRMHGLIFGSTGSGKSKTIEAVAGGLLDLGWSGMIMDLKEDLGLRNWCEEYAIHHSMPFQEFRLSDPDPRFWFNPLLGMGPDEARDTILSMNTFEAAYYEAINKKQLGQVCGLMWDAHTVDPVAFPIPTMKDIGKLLSAPDLKAASKKMVATVVTAVPNRTTEDYSSLVNPTKAEAEASSGLGARLISMYETQAGRNVLTPAPTRQVIDVTQPGLTYVGLDSLGKPDLTRMASSAMLLRMSVYAAERTTSMAARKSTPPPRFLIVDEANWVNRTVVMNILSRARSAGIAMILATQGPLDFEVNNMAGAPGFGALAQNTNVAIIMAQGELENAEVCADYIGKAEKLTFSQSVRDNEFMDAGSTKAVRDHIVSPDDLRNMGIGEAIIRVGKPTTRITWLNVRIRDPKAGARR